MKALGGIAFTSLILTLLIIYFLQPLNAGAIALVFLISFSVLTLLIKAIKYIFKSKNTGGGNVN